MPEISTTGQEAQAGDLEVQQTDDILTLCKQREDEGMAKTKTWQAMWEESLRYFLSDQLRGRKQHKDWDWVILNYIWPAIMQEMAKLSRNFKIIVSATEQSDTDVAEAFQGFLQWQWKKGLHRHGMRVEQLKAILDSKLYGYRVSKVLWESKVRWSAKERKWLGEVRHRLWHPAEFWASDKEYINDGDCGTVRYLELGYAQSLWPDFKDSLAENAVSYPDMIKGGGGDNIAGQTLSSGTYPAAGTGSPDKGDSVSQMNSLLDLVLTSDRVSVGAGNDSRRFCKISEAYLKDRTEERKTEEVPVDPDVLLQSGMVQPGPNGAYLSQTGEPLTAEQWPNDVTKWDEPVYPNGRYIIRNEDTILNPDDQVYPHSVWPFIVIPHYLLPHMWQGTDAVTLYKNTQDHINVTVSHLVNNMKMFGDPRVAIEQDALAVPPGRTKKRFAIMRGAGSIIRLARGGLSKMKIIDPVPPSASAIMLYQLFAQEYKNIQGLHDIAQGKKTSGSTTATEAQFLAISSNDRIKLQNIFEEEWVHRIVSLTAEMDQHYYEVGRLVRIIGEDQILGAQQITDRAKTAEFDIDIEAGEGLPYDEEKRQILYEKAYQILSNPNPNPLLPEYLRILKISGWQKILAKHEGWRTYMEFAKILEAVDGGQLSPQDAVQLVIQRMTQLFMVRQAEKPQGVQNGTRNS